jgi:4-hydroxybutyrate dehydrogenase/sulfolactaldehyde 3-reductase|tara:strand:- start:127 stop:1047 length:921 start_codon:yes stop_codon:yes gene_type:complete
MMSKSLKLNKKITFIGLGVMGSPISLNLVKKKFNVVGYDIDPHVRKKHRNLGINCEENLVDAVRDSSVVITMLPTSDIVKETYFGEEGGKGSLINHVENNCLFIDMTTGSVPTLFDIQKQLLEAGHRFIDAPIGRSPREAKVGKCLVMAGGAKEDFNEAKQIFESIADTIFHVGPFGSGLTLKLVNNYLAMINHVATGEALAFAKAAGLDLDLAVEVLSTTSAGKGQLLTNFPEKVLAGDLTADFSIDMGVKDLRMSIELAALSNFRPGFGELAKSSFLAASELGMGGQDCTAILNYFTDKGRVLE